MAFWRRFLQRADGDKLAACTALDVGTEFAKALVFEIADDGTATVRGVGRKRQGLTHMQSGTVADITAVVDNCQVALQEAEEMAGFRSRQVIIGIAGELVKGFTTSVSQERKKPDQQLSARELDSLIETVQKDAMREAERTVTWETGLPNVDVRLVHAAVTGASIDGYTVTNPVGFHGRHVRISVFNAFAPLIHLGALQTVAAMLDLELVAIVAEPYAVAQCIDDDQVRQAGALFVDVGGGTTDVALVRQGGIEGTRMFALGGRAFTKSLADRLDLPFARAEETKVDYAKGVQRRTKEGDRRDHWRGCRRVAGRRRARARGVRPVGHAAWPDLPVRGRGPFAAAQCRVARSCAHARTCPFARPPQVDAIKVKPGGQSHRRDRLARRRAGHHADGARQPGARDDRARVAARRCAAARAPPDEGLTDCQ